MWFSRSLRPLSAPSPFETFISHCQLGCVWFISENVDVSKWHRFSAPSIANKILWRMTNVTNDQRNCNFIRWLSHTLQCQIGRPTSVSRNWLLICDILCTCFGEFRTTRAVMCASRQLIVQTQTYSLGTGSIDFYFKLSSKRQQGIQKNGCK